MTEYSFIHNGLKFFFNTEEVMIEASHMASECTEEGELQLLLMAEEVEFLTVGVKHETSNYYQMSLL